MKYINSYLIVFLFAFSISSAALADDEYSDEPVTESCVSAGILGSPEIIDDGRIVFRASRKRLYLNTLPSSCRGLKKHGRISYHKESRPCANDRFNVLERVGSGLRLGISCRLGRFQPISQDELEELNQPPPVEHVPQPVEGAEIEEIGED